MIRRHTPEDLPNIPSVTFIWDMAKFFETWQYQASEVQLNHDVSNTKFFKPLQLKSVVFRYYLPLVLLMNLTLPTYITYNYIGEDFWTSVIVTFGRYVLSLNGTWLVNSAAHIWGMKPYDKWVFTSQQKFQKHWHRFAETLNQQKISSWLLWPLEKVGITITTCSLGTTKQPSWGTTNGTSPRASWILWQKLGGPLIWKPLLRKSSGKGSELGENGAWRLSLIFGF